MGWGWDDLNPIKQVTQGTGGDSGQRSNFWGTLGTGGLLPGADWNTFGSGLTPGQPATQAPPPPPVPGDIRQAGLMSQVSQEQRMASASTILTGGSGLLEQPTTASHVLLGS